MGPHRSHLTIDSSASQLCGTEQASLSLDVLTCQMGTRMADRIKGDNVCESDHCSALGLSLPESPTIVCSFISSPGDNGSSPEPTFSSLAHSSVQGRAARLQVSKPGHMDS